MRCFWAWAVALLAEGVDRNDTLEGIHAPGHVALLAEGVDRNLVYRYPMNHLFEVALLAEGVDRNKECVWM